LPFTPLISGDGAGENSAAPYDVPDRVVALHQPGLLQLFRPDDAIGNSGRNSLIGPGLAELDFSVNPYFPIRFISEAARLQFRAEALNLANRKNLERPLPNNALYNSNGAPLATAGRITSTATTSRQIQLALRLSW
jgi:hypothetical protein